MGGLLQNQKLMLWSRKTPQTSYCYALRNLGTCLVSSTYFQKKLKKKHTLHSFGSLSHMHQVIKKYVTFSIFFSLFAHLINGIQDQLHKFPTQRRNMIKITFIYYYLITNYRTIIFIFKIVLMIFFLYQ